MSDDRDLAMRALFTGLALDLDGVVASLSHPERLCVVLSYHEGLSDAAIADLTGLAPERVRFHIRRGTQHLQCLLTPSDDHCLVETNR